MAASHRASDMLMPDNHVVPQWHTNIARIFSVADKRRVNYVGYARILPRKSIDSSRSDLH